MDISKYGAGLQLQQIVVDTHHFFYSPQDDSSKLLYLEILFSDERTLSIPIFPVWMDHDPLISPNPFKIGVEFMTEPGDEQVAALIRLMKGKKKEGGWLKGLFSEF